MLPARRARYQQGIGDQKRTVRDAGAVTTREMRVTMDLDKRIEARRSRGESVEELGDSKERRNGEIAEFRFRQSGGADGQTFPPISKMRHETDEALGYRSWRQ